MLTSKTFFVMQQCLKNRKKLSVFYATLKALSGDWGNLKTDLRERLRNSSPASPPLKKITNSQTSKNLKLQKLNLILTILRYGFASDGNKFSKPCFKILGTFADAKM